MMLYCPHGSLGGISNRQVKYLQSTILCDRMAMANCFDIGISGGIKSIELEEDS